VKEKAILITPVPGGAGLTIAMLIMNNAKAANRRQGSGHMGDEMENSFQMSLADPDRMSVTWELIPGRGAREKLQEGALMAGGNRRAKGGRIDAVTIRTNPGGNPAIWPIVWGQEILKLGGTAGAFHLQGPDRNQMKTNSMRWTGCRCGIWLVMTGDYP